MPAVVARVTWVPLARLPHARAFEVERAGQLLLVLLVVHHVAVRLQHHPAKQQQTRVNLLVSSILEACVDFFSTFGRIRTFRLCATCRSRSIGSLDVCQACGGVLYAPSLLPLGPALHSLPALLHHEPGVQCVRRLPSLLRLGVGPDAAQLRHPCEVFAQATWSVKLAAKTEGPTRDNENTKCWCQDGQKRNQRGPRFHLAIVQR